MPAIPNGRLHTMYTQRKLMIRIALFTTKSNSMLTGIMKSNSCHSHSLVPNQSIALSRI